MEKAETSGIANLSCTEKLQAVGDSLYAIGGKWTLRVIITLSQGHKHFNDIKRTIPGLSGKVLANELKELELNGFIKRTVHSGQMPVVVEYELTTYSQSLKDVIYALIGWGVNHREKIKQEHKSGNR